jgi:hypothetical protein
MQIFVAYATKICMAQGTQKRPGLEEDAARTCMLETCATVRWLIARV